MGSSEMHDKYYAEYAPYKKSACENCGALAYVLVGDYPVKKKLTVHHVDGNVANNAPENLKTLCRKCHDKEHGGFS